MFIFVPLFFVLVDLGVHGATDSDADDALRQGAIGAMRQGISEGSLRDTNVRYDVNGNPTDEYRTQYAVNPDRSDIEEYFDLSFSRKQRGTLFNLAERDTEKGLSYSPPLLGVRANTVRDSVVYRSVGQFFPGSNGSYVIQNQQIAILEMKETD